MSVDDLTAMGPFLDERSSAPEGPFGLGRRHAASPRAQHAVIRLFDILVASAVLVFGAPLLTLIAFAVRAGDGGPVFFRQQRIGLDGRSFEIFKFRTMCTDAARRLEDYLAAHPEARAEWARDRKLRNDPRVTAIGNFLRKSSLDELPQLFNVIAGEMSIVGPRPIVPSEAELYGRHFRHYCSVPPGITGLWQVSGRNDVSYNERVAMDVYYAKNRSFALNLAIIFRTVPALLLARGSY